MRSVQSAQRTDRQTVVVVGQVVTVMMRMIDELTDCVINVSRDQRSPPTRSTSAGEQQSHSPNSRGLPLRIPQKHHSPLHSSKSKNSRRREEQCSGQTL